MTAASLAARLVRLPRFTPVRFVVDAERAGQVEEVRRPDEQLGSVVVGVVIYVSADRPAEGSGEREAPPCPSLPIVQRDDVHDEDADLPGVLLAKGEEAAGE